MVKGEEGGGSNGLGVGGGTGFYASICFGLKTPIRNRAKENNLRRITNLKSFGLTLCFS